MGPTRRALLTLLALLVWLTPAWTEEVILFTRPDGGLSVVNPAPACLADLQRPVATEPGPGGCPQLGLTRAGALGWVRQKSVPPDATAVETVDRSTLPPSRRFRDAWRRNGARIQENIVEARKVRQQALERASDKRVTASQAQGRAAQDAGDLVKAIAHQTYRNDLRAIRRNLPTDLGAITDLDTLAIWTPAYPVSP